MERIAALQTLYTEYHQEADKVRKSARAFDGIFGLGKDPRNDPCHQAFYHSVEKWMKDFLAEEPSAEAAAAAATFMLETPARYRKHDSYWFMYACMGMVNSLLPFLNKQTCAALAAQFDKDYPKFDRMPVQQKLYKDLVKAGK